MKNETKEKFCVPRIVTWSRTKICFTVLLTLTSLPVGEGSCVIHIPVHFYDFNLDHGLAKKQQQLEVMKRIEGDDLNCY